MSGCRLILLMSLLIIASSSGAKKPRIAKINHKIPSDTIVIPETIFDDELPSDTIVPIYMEIIEEDIIEPSISDYDDIDASLSILGEMMVDEETMFNFVRKRNPRFNREISKAYYEVGKTYGIRGDVALCQAIVETGWFLFIGGTAVTLDQNNFCGLGVTKKGLKGNSFESVTEGVTAQIQHLYAYATKEKLPQGEKTVDPRFSLVPRGVAPTWNDLNMRWAANSRYGESIIKVFKDMLSQEE